MKAQVVNPNEGLDCSIIVRDGLELLQGNFAQTVNEGNLHITVGHKNPISRKGADIKIAIYRNESDRLKQNGMDAVSATFLSMMLQLNKMGKSYSAHTHGDFANHHGAHLNLI